MFRFILAIIFAIIALVAFIIKVKGRRFAESNPSHRDAPSAESASKAAASVAVVFAVLAPLFLAWSVVRIIPANNVGIPVTLGTIGSPKQSGLIVVVPWTDITNISTRLQVTEFIGPVEGGESDDAIQLRTKDEYPLDLEASVRWSVKKESADDLFREVGSLSEIEEKIVRQIAREAFRNVSTTIDATDIYGENRSEYGKAVFALLDPLFDAAGLELDDVNVRDIGLSTQLAQSIDAKTEAQEDAERAIINQKEEITKAETKREVAKTDAEALLIAAQATASANELVDQSLTPDILRLRELEALMEADTIYVPLGADILIGATSASGS